MFFEFGCEASRLVVHYAIALCENFDEKVFCDSVECLSFICNSCREPSSIVVLVLESRFKVAEY